MTALSNRFAKPCSHPLPKPTENEGALDVSFQEVVHSDLTEETGVTKLQHS
jgi:hypothetical protein